MWNTSSWSGVGLVGGSTASLVGMGRSDAFASTYPRSQAAGLPLGPVRSVEFWFSSSDAGAWPEWLVSFWGGGNAGGGDATNRWTIAIQAGNSVSVDDLLWGSTEYGVGCSSASYFDGKPHMVDYTGDGTTNFLYIDGTQCATSTQLNKATWGYVCGVAMGGGADYPCGGTSESASYPIASSVHVGQLSIYDVALTPTQIANHFGSGGGPKRQILFVHDFATDYTSYTPGHVNSVGFIDPMIARYGDANVKVFPEFQDLAYRLFDGSCGAGAPAADLTGAPYIAVDPFNSASQPAQCDSQGDLGINASRLDTYIKDPANQLRRPLTVVGYSMGGGIVRGWLDIAAGSNDATLQTVDSVGFIQGAQQGSWVAGLQQDLAHGRYAWRRELDAALVPLINSYAKSQFGVEVHLDRPAIKLLAPQSVYYSGPKAIRRPVPSNLHYFNFYSNFRIQPQVHALLWTIPDTPFDFGDDLFRPGNPDPASPVQFDGGARFLPPNAAPGHAHEFAYMKTLYLDEDNIFSKTASWVVIVTTLVFDPGTHFNFETHMADGQVTVFSCTNGAPIRPDDQILTLLAGIDSGTLPCR